MDVFYKSKGFTTDISQSPQTTLNPEPIDISNFYSKSQGNGSANEDQIDFDTNYKISGVDLRYYFRKK